jgi:hypothetical protein
MDDDDIIMDDLEPIYIKSSNIDTTTNENIECTDSLGEFELDDMLFAEEKNEKKEKKPKSVKDKTKPNNPFSIDSTKHIESKFDPMLDSEDNVDNYDIPSENDKPDKFVSAKNAYNSITPPAPLSIRAKYEKMIIEEHRTTGLTEKEIFYANETERLYQVLLYDMERDHRKKKYYYHIARCKLPKDTKSPFDNKTVATEEELPYEYCFNQEDKQPIIRLWIDKRDKRLGPLMEDMLFVEVVNLECGDVHFSTERRLDNLAEHKSKYELDTSNSEKMNIFEDQTLRLVKFPLHMNCKWYLLEDIPVRNPNAPIDDISVGKLMANKYVRDGMQHVTVTSLIHAAFLLLQQLEAMIRHGSRNYQHGVVKNISPCLPSEDSHPLSVRGLSKKNMDNELTTAGALAHFQGVGPSKGVGMYRQFGSLGKIAVKYLECETEEERKKMMATIKYCGNDTHFYGGNNMSIEGDYKESNIGPKTSEKIYASFWGMLNDADEWDQSRVDKMATRILFEMFDSKRIDETIVNRLVTRIKKFKETKKDKQNGNDSDASSEDNNSDNDSDAKPKKKNKNNKKQKPNKKHKKNDTDDDDDDDDGNNDDESEIEYVKGSTKKQTKTKSTKQTKSTKPTKQTKHTKPTKPKKPKNNKKKNKNASSGSSDEEQQQRLDMYNVPTKARHPVFNNIMPNIRVLQ